MFDLYPPTPSPTVVHGGTAFTGSTVDVHALVISILVAAAVGLVLIAVSYWHKRRFVD